MKKPFKAEGTLLKPQAFSVAEAKPKRQTIKSLAKEIRERFPKLHVHIRSWKSDTDRKIGRLRWPGKGRTGDRITVTDANGEVLLDHKNSETYRTTSEVREWLDWCIKRGKPGTKGDMWNNR